MLPINESVVAALILCSSPLRSFLTEQFLTNKNSSTIILRVSLQNETDCDLVNHVGDTTYYFILDRLCAFSCYSINVKFSKYFVNLVLTIPYVLLTHTRIFFIRIPGCIHFYWHTWMQMSPIFCEVPRRIIVKTMLPFWSC